VHHQRPNIPWTELPLHAPEDEPHVGFWRQYLAMWRGPRLNHEEAPMPQ